MSKESKHPKGLMVLFFTEMWERFGFYLMLGIFTLYMIAGKGQEFPGMGFSLEKSADIYGTYLALVYLTPFFGGLIADRILGYRNSISIGGFLMGLGYIGLAFPNESIFFISLLLIIIGNGFFKPNISALVGKLYDNEKYKDMKDAGFNIFYMGINVGAFVCNFIAAYLRINYGWGWAFAAAGIGMFIGLIWFWSGQLYAKDLKEVDQISPREPGEKSLGRIALELLGPGVAAGVVGWFLPTMLFGQPIFGKESTDAFLFFSIPIVIFYISLYKREYKTALNNALKSMSEIDAKKEAKRVSDPVKALLTVMAVVVVFWAIFHQNGSALTVWAEKYTDREVTGVVENAVTSLDLNQEVTTEMREVKKLDAHGVPVVDGHNEPVTELGPDPYFENVPQEEWPENGKENLISAELFQSINPGFIILLTPLVVGFFNWRRRRGRPVSTPSKIGYGLLITALSALVMVAAVIVTNNGAFKASPAWLFGVYGVITIGELCLSPMGLSLVSKLSPPRIVALMMGGWFLSTAIGNKLSGVLSGLWNMYENKAYFFLTNTALAMISVILIFSMLPWLKRVVKEHTGHE
jgi:POT family proton-dependent oligopeptide transporter